jgi:hypothetical protein
MPNRTEARSAKAALTNATGRLPLLRLFSTPLILPAASEAKQEESAANRLCLRQAPGASNLHSLLTNQRNELDLTHLRQRL